MGFRKFILDQLEDEKKGLKRLISSTFLKRARRDEEFSKLEEEKRLQKIKRFEALQKGMGLPGQDSDDEDSQIRPIEFMNENDPEVIDEEMKERRRMDEWRQQVDMKRMLMEVSKLFPIRLLK
jgi:hypothetical protein